MLESVNTKLKIFNALLDFSLPPFLSAQLSPIYKNTNLYTGRADGIEMSKSAVKANWIYSSNSVFHKMKAINQFYKIDEWNWEKMSFLIKIVIVLW